jgi:ubiquitin C-terminal hydrolase
MGETLNFADFFASESDDISKKWNYDVCGVSDHHGSHMGGHYTAQFKHPVTKEWWWIDDESCHKLEGPRFGNSNYIYLLQNSI